METVDRAIRATLAYYGALQWPLTTVEVAQRLIPPRRVGGSDDLPSAAGVVAVLDALAVRGDAVRQGGLYGAADIPERAFAGRMLREQETEQKWRRMRRRVPVLAAAPYVDALLASGSLAMGSAGPDSDWDMFVVARAGRLYTARAFLLALAWLTGRLRTKRHRVAPDRFCFNHYVTTDGLALRHRSMFTAHALATLVPVVDPENYGERLRGANAWAAHYIAMPGPLSAVHREVRRPRLLGAVRRAVECILDSPVGALLERLLRRWQQTRIAHEPATHASGGRVVADDRELEFHPHSLERAVLDRYNRALAGMGMERFAEPDSGLTK